MGKQKAILITFGSILLTITIVGIIFNSFLPISFDYRVYNIGYDLEDAFPNIKFDDLVHLTHDGSTNLYAVEQRGLIKKFHNNADVTTTSVFLDISKKVQCCGELGLLGMTFDPNFATNGYFYIDYTSADPLRTIISRYQFIDGSVDIDSELIILEIEQPFGNHNGGTITFGLDGLLYIAVGDGGSAGDPQNNGQSLETLLGSILRINVSHISTEQPYHIPKDNPFINHLKAKHEIWAFGLRNPWRISFDSLTGDLWAGDVGQNRFEEVDLIEKGKNYGWNTMEGFACYQPEENCDKEGLTLPIVTYGRDVGKSISGGYVYRGTQITDLYGKYIFGDYVTGRIWYLNAETPNNPNMTEIIKKNILISGLGVDNNNEIYVLEYSDGIIYKIVPLATTVSE